MQIHRIRAATLKDALIRARQTLGDNAVVVSQEVLPGGEVALAVALRESTSTPSAVFRAPQSTASESPALRELTKRLEKQGASADFCSQIREAVRPRLEEGPHALDLAAEEIAKRFAPAKLNKIPGKTRVLTLVGATGSGKTTTLVKLASAMKQAGRMVELATLDSHRVGSVEQLRAFATLLEVPMTVLKRGVRMNPTALASGGIDMLLLDTTGHAQQDLKLIQQLNKAFEQAPIALDVQLVLPATLSERARQEQYEVYKDLNPSGCVITKLDDTADKASGLEFAWRQSLPVAFLCDGTRIESDLHRATGSTCADLLLMGRIA